MIGKSTAVWIVLAAVASVALYQTSYEVQAQADRLSHLNRQIVAEQEAIQVLNAEWAHLNDPSRLERLVAQHLLLQPMQAAQIVALDAIPEKPTGAEGELLLSSLATPTPARKPERAARPAAPVQVAEDAPARTAAPVVLATFGRTR